MKKRYNLLTSKKAASRQLVGVLITVLVIVLLLLSGPANAFDLSLGAPSDTTPTQGDIVDFTATAEVIANEIVPIANLSLDFSDGTSCYFTVAGDILTPDECTGITITQTEDSTDYTSGLFNFTAAGIIHDDYGSGFGYGYASPGPSRLIYDVTLDTDEFDRGELTYSLNVHIEGDTYSSDEESITIRRESSGGGGSTIPPPNPSNTMVWTQMTPGSASIMKIRDDATGITQIIIMVKNPAQNVKIVIEKLPGQPASISKTITGKVFSFLKITKQNLEDSNLDGNAKLQFKVPLSWLTSNAVDPKNIVLKRFASNNWQDLKTTLLSQDSRFAYFEAETPGFSYFAIAEKSAEPTAVPKAEEPTAPMVEETGAVITTPEIKATTAQPEKSPATTTTEAKTSTGVQVAIVVIVVVAIGLIILTSTGRKKRLKPVKEMMG